jgi:chorismate mutase/prephenate dehydratase
MNIKKLRNDIDNIDEQIQVLLSKRAQIALKIGKRKEYQNIDFYNPSREKEILEMVKNRNTGPLANGDLCDIFKKIFTACLSIQNHLNIAILGPLGSFSHEAVMTKFGRNIKLTPCNSIKDVFECVEKNKVSYGFVPIENSIEGIVNQTIDALSMTTAKISDEFIMRINQYLLSSCLDIQQITQVYSHPQAFAQCQEWLKKHLPNAALIPVSSTSRAAMLAEKEATTAAIASKFTLEYHKLNILAEHIEDVADNSTRFLIISSRENENSKNNKTCTLVWLQNKPGTLSTLLNHFANNHVNLTLIESRPCKHKIWEYFFFLEIDGNKNELKLKKTFKALEQNKFTYKILGSFSKAV